jgi:hypothetical protein
MALNSNLVCLFEVRRYDSLEHECRGYISSDQVVDAGNTSD